MTAHLVDWLSLLVRWLHVITGIAWIGASFYFNWLEGRLDRAQPKPERIAGQLWAVHGGGFYHLQKYEVAPERLPETLHWFKWEAYTTWISGMLLLLLVYYLNPVMLLGANPLGMGTGPAMVTGLGSLVAAWGLYHWLCSTALVDRPAVFAALGCVLLGAMAYGLSQLFDPRAAYLHVGAVIGTLMVANVFFVIIPAQRLMVDALSRGEAPDPAPGRNALRRSLHNNYLTLPVVFIMISHHFPATYGHPQSWLVLVLLGVGSALVRHYFNLRNMHQQRGWVLPVAALFLVALIWMTRPISPASIHTTQGGDARFWQVRQVIDHHCTSCHSANPTDPVFTIAPMGLTLDTPEEIQAAAPAILDRAVRTQTMPLGNASEMSEEDRGLLGRWIESGARIE